MNTVEARRVLTENLGRFRVMTYDELCKFVGSAQTIEVTAPSGTWYQVELQAFWDDPKRPNAVLRVVAAIDDGGLRVYSPLSDNFLIKPDGSLVGDDVA